MTRGTSDSRRSSHSPHVAVGGPRGELVDERQREAAQVLEVREVALDAGDARRVGILAARLLQLQAVLGGEAVEARPAVASGDDGGLDEPVLPAVRGARPSPGSTDGRRQWGRRIGLAASGLSQPLRCRVRSARGRLARGARRPWPARRRRDARARGRRGCAGAALVLGLVLVLVWCTVPAVLGAGPRSCRRSRCIRNLRQRQVLREAVGGQVLVGAREQGEQRAAGGMRAARAAAEPHGDPRAREGVLERGRGTRAASGGTRPSRRSGHPDAPRRARSARSRRPRGLRRGGEEDDVVRAVALRRFVGREEEPAQASQVGVRVRPRLRLRAPASRERRATLRACRLVSAPSPGAGPTGRPARRTSVPSPRTSATPAPTPSSDDWPSARTNRSSPGSRSPRRAGRGTAAAEGVAGLEGLLRGGEEGRAVGGAAGLELRGRPA